MDSQLIPSSPSKSSFDHCSFYKKGNLPTRIMREMDFQIKLLLWILLEALSKGYRFQLATNFVLADMFDDLVLHYGEESEAKYRLVHIAYNPGLLEYIMKEPLSSFSSYSLRKSFFSYQKIKNRAPFLGRCIKDVTLFIDSKIKFKVSPFFIEIDEEDDIFCGQRYRLTKHAATCLKTPLENKLAMILEELAQCLADCIIQPRKKGPQKEMLSDYIAILCNDVLDISTKQFRPELLSNSQGLSDGAKMFRPVLEKTLKQRLERDEDLEQLVTDSRIDLRYLSHLSNRKKDFLPWPSVSDEEIQDFIDHLVLAVSRPIELEQIIQEKLAKRFSAEKADNVLHYLEQQLTSWCRQTTGSWLANEHAESWMIVAKLQLAMAKECTPFKADFEEYAFIAAGGFGAVYKARNKVDDIDYAVKMIIIRPQSAEKIFQEVRLLARLHHPHIVPFENAWLDNCSTQMEREIKTKIDQCSLHSSEVSSEIKGGSKVSSAIEKRPDCDQSLISPSSPLMVLSIQMKFCPTTLRKWLDDRNSQIDLLEENKREIEIFRQILLGIDYIHSIPIVHRDIKPENIFLCEATEEKKTTENWLIGDFGLAKILKSETNGRISNDDRLTSSALAPYSNEMAPIATKGVGTPSYASPEQLESTDYGAKSDLFSLGVVFMELLSVFKTTMGLDISIKSLRNGRQVPEMIKQKWPSMAQLILDLTSGNPESRPSPKEAISRLTGPSVEAQHSEMTDKVADLQRQIEDLREQLSHRDDKVANLQQQIEVLKKMRPH